MTRRPHVAFVVQRCGDDVNGGAEALCRDVAKHMLPHWDVEILTTRALDYTTWADHYSEGICEVQGVPVRRFSVDAPRDPATFARLSTRVLAPGYRASRREAHAWMHEQGPRSTTLLRYVKTNARAYDLFVFYTYLYATTVDVLPLVKRCAVLVPCAHDEPPLRLPIFDELFAQARLCLFNTPEEEHLLRWRFPRLPLHGKVVAGGLDSPPATSSKRFHEVSGVRGRYILYLGRIDANKGCVELLDHFLRYCESHDNEVSLVLIGKPVMAIPTHSRIVPLGFVDEQTKWDALAGCSLLVNSSPYESLSLVLLEAWSLNRPTLANGRCEVLVGQSRRSNSGLWYMDGDEFGAMVDYLLEYGDDIAARAREFVHAGYSWPIVTEAYRALLPEST